MMKLMLLGMAAGAMAFGASSVYDFTLTSIDGAAAPLSSFKGKVVLLVNVASKCGFTPQYAGLEKLYETYKDKGFVLSSQPQVHSTQKKSFFATFSLTNHIPVIRG